MLALQIAERLSCACTGLEVVPLCQPQAGQQGAFLMIRGRSLPGLTDLMLQTILVPPQAAATHPAQLDGIQELA